MRRVDDYDLCIATIVMIGIIGCCLILFGCKTRKTVDEAERTHVEKRHDEVKEEQKEDRKAESVKEVDITSWRSSDIDVTIDEYDTEKADSTGKSPLKKRTTIKGKADEAQQENTKVEARSEERKESKKESNSNTDESDKENHKNEVTKDSNRFGAIKLLAFNIIVLMIVVYLTKHRK